MRFVLILALLLTVGQVNARQQNDVAEKIELNKGKKWKVPMAMMQHLNVMQEDIARARENNLKNYKALSLSLEKEIDLLTSNCTMKGKGHDELHKWLVPFIGDVKNFSKSTNVQQQRKQLDHLYNEFARLKQYFE